MVGTPPPPPPRTGCVSQLLHHVVACAVERARQSLLDDPSGNIADLKMKVLVAVLALAVAVSARPGGYTTNGGVYNPTKELDYMEHARSAGKFAPLISFSMDWPLVNVFVCVSAGYRHFAICFFPVCSTQLQVKILQNLASELHWSPCYLVVVGVAQTLVLPVLPSQSQTYCGSFNRPISTIFTVLSVGFSAMASQ